ncbi:MAG: DUF4114 domain-containing protein, partial [Thiovulaceae bacterium]|nr:DUF4114 domain-containing protein [Sulfurimonadaceae bacterium]
DEDTTDAVAEDTTDEETTDAVAEQTVDEDTTNALAEDTTPEQTVDMIPEETTDEQVITPSSEEDTTPENVITDARPEATILSYEIISERPEDTEPENTVDAVAEDTIDEDTVAAIPEDTTNEVVNIPASDEATIDEDTTEPVAESTVDEATLDAVPEVTTDESTTDAQPEQTVDEDTSIPEDTVAEQTVDATDEQTQDVPESTEVTTETLVDPSEIIYLPNEDGSTGQDTNLVITLDISGSMSMSRFGGEITLEDGSTTTRFEIAKESLIDTIEAYQGSGDVEVNLTMFGDSAKNIGWMSGDDAVDYLQNLTMDSNGRLYSNGAQVSDLNTMGTDYLDGINATKGIDFTGHNADKTVGFFISDGEPNSHEKYVNSDSDSAIVAWKDFIDTNIDELNVIGVGSGVSDQYLNIIQTQDGESAQIITDDTQLGEALEEIVVDSTPVVDEAAMLDAGYVLNADGKWVSISTEVVNNTTEDTTDATPEQTVDEQTQDAQVEDTTDEQTTDAVAEDTTDAVAESTIDESTIDEDTYDNSGADTSNLNHSGDSTGIISLGHDVDDLDIEIKSYKPSKDEGEVILYKDREEVGRVSIDDIYDSRDNADTTITINGGTVFDSYEVVHTGNAYGWGHHSQEFKVGGAYENNASEDTTPEDTTDAIPESTTEVVSESTTPEDTSYETASEETTDEQTTDATGEQTIDEDTTDAVNEQTVDEDTTEAVAEDTVDEDTTEAVTEQTTPEDTIDAIAEDTENEVVNTPASEEQTTDEDTVDAVTVEDTTDEQTTNGGEESTTPEDTTTSGLGGNIDYVNEDAGHDNVVGIYSIDENGNPVNAQVLIDNQHTLQDGTQLADMVSDGQEYGFFIIDNGANSVDSNSVITFDNSSDTPVLLVNGEAIEAPTFYSQSELNNDGVDHFIFEADGEGGTTIRIEDLPNNGDADFNDVVLHTDLDIQDGIFENSINEDTIDEQTSYEGLPEETVAEDTTDAVEEDTTDEDTTDAVDENTVDEDTTEAVPESTVDEDTIEAVAESTVDEDTT